MRNGRVLELQEFYKNNIQYIFKLEQPKIKDKIGNKAINLQFLHKKGFKTPKTIICSHKSFDDYQSNADKVLSNLRKELNYYIDEQKYYSIRSSADIEDDSDFSYAGQFETFLNQKGLDSIIESIIKVWNSQDTNKTQTYSKEFAQTNDKIRMSVIIQEMVFPEYSGVVFTRNPVTGLNETIIESVKGLGDNLVQLGKTPERWINKWGDWIEKPFDYEIKIDFITKIVQESRKIAKKYGKPLDLEWAHDGRNLYWIQLRQITTLKNNKLYSNKLSRQMLPGMIKPLIWSVNIPVVCMSWKHIFEELIGSSAKNIDIYNLAHPFYYRAYFNMKIMGDIFELLGMPRDLLENLAGIDSEGKDKPSFKPSGRTLFYLPRIVIFCLKMFNFSKTIEKFLRSNKKTYTEINNIKLDELDEDEVFAIIYRLFKINTKASYVVIITQILNNVYNKFLKSKLNKKNIKFENLDFSVVNNRLNNLDPRSQISKLYKEINKLPEFNKEMNYEAFHKKYKETKIFESFQRFLSEFGYLRDNGNDFSESSWSETPDLIFKMVRDYKDPKIKKIDKQELPKIKQEIFNSPLSSMLFNRAIKYLEYRLSVTNLYSYGYGLFRKFFLRISEIFLTKQLIKEKDDIFYLKFEEVKELAENNEIAFNMQNMILKRKTEMKKYANFHLPDIIYDDNLPEPINQDKINNELMGTPTSKGFYIGPVKIINGINDMDKINDGDIIAIPYSDVSWTPLFIKAGAVISESGGILSHASIVAREYKIPAVVSVEGATILKDNMMVAVDAFKGKISILNDNFNLDNLVKDEILKKH
ncbi:MAG: hypothetical protein HWN80_16650 [Candidatus Lokiarchaeota archaeon]|nr:hypothetical protein [Candidatus Lokiarchaeota archaeon]